jgi:succinate dehydrogenase / fumarate reductase, iron-sulfur subunit
MVVLEFDTGGRALRSSPPSQRLDVAMAGSTPNLPEPYQLTSAAGSGTAIGVEFHISEFAAEYAGAMSPFGDDLEFPLAVEQLGYRHPGPADRPHLAGD